MISKKETKLIAGKYNKKIGIQALKKLDQIIVNEIKEIIRKSARKADIKGSIVIKKEDI